MDRSACLEADYWQFPVTTGECCRWCWWWLETSPGNAWVFSLLISRPEKMKSVRIIVCPQASKYGSRWNQAVYSMRILLHWQFFKIFRFGWQQIQDLAVMERSQKSAMTTNHSLEPRSIGDFTSEGFTLMTRSWRVNMRMYRNKKKCFPHPKKTL